MPRLVVPTRVFGVGGLAKRVEFLMQRQDQWRVFRNAQSVGRHLDALLFQLGDFAEQRVQVDHHAIADHRQLAAAHHAGGQQRQLVCFTVDHQRMAGVVSALEADDDIGLLGQPVDDLAFAFVAPLRADNHHVGHRRCFPCAGARTLYAGERPAKSTFG